MKFSIPRLFFKTGIFQQLTVTLAYTNLSTPITWVIIVDLSVRINITTSSNIHIPIKIVIWLKHSISSYAINVTSDWNTSVWWQHTEDFWPFLCISFVIYRIPVVMLVCQLSPWLSQPNWYFSASWYRSCHCSWITSSLTITDLICYPLVSLVFMKRVPALVILTGKSFDKWR